MYVRMAVHVLDHSDSAKLANVCVHKTCRVVAKIVFEHFLSRPVQVGFTLLLPSSSPPSPATEDSSSESESESSEEEPKKKERRKWCVPLVVD